MKRDPGLSELSRDHLPALILAYRLRHGRSSNPQQPWPTEPLAQWHQALPFIRGELRRHFLAEERFLVPVRLEDRASSGRILAEHAEFWRQVERIEALAADQSTDATALPPLLQGLGELLEAHIRFEERTWFGQLQQALTVGELTLLGERIEAFLAEG